MSDPNQGFQPPPPPVVATEPERQRPVKLLWAGIVLIVLGILVAIGGIAGFIAGGMGTGLAVCALGILLAALSFARLPSIPDAPPPMSTVGRLTGIFFEPTNVFRNLRAHPRWLAAILIIGVLNAAYVIAFTRRISPERIINFTVEKLEESPIKPPPEALEKMRTDGAEAAKSPVQQAGNVVKGIVSTFFGSAFVAGLFLLGVLAFGGRMHFWQAFSAAVYSSFPVVVIQKVISFIILYIKSPDDIHPILGQETLVTDNLGILFAAKDHPVLFVLGSVIGILSFYRLWLTATGLRETGYKVSSTAGWSVAIMLWLLALLFGVALAMIFPGFLA
jgi:hypothetical protein